YPDHASTLRIIEAGRPQRVVVEALVELKTITAMTELAREVHTSPLILDYIARIVDATRNATQVRLGASMRGAMSLARASRVWAIGHDRTYVTPDDVKLLADAVL